MKHKIPRLAAHFPAFWPILTVYPETCWYGAHSDADVQRLVEVHLVGGEVVEDLLIKERS